MTAVFSEALFGKPLTTDGNAIGLIGRFEAEFCFTNGDSGVDGTGGGGGTVNDGGSPTLDAILIASYAGLRLFIGAKLTRFGTATPSIFARLACLIKVLI